MSRFYFYVDAPDGRQYFKDIKQANVFAQQIADQTGQPAFRGDLDGGKSYLYPQTVTK